LPWGKSGTEQNAKRSVGTTITLHAIASATRAKPKTVGGWFCKSKNDQTVANSENPLLTSIPRTAKRSFARKFGATPGHASGATSFGARTTRSDGATSWRFNAVDVNGTARERSVTRAIAAIGGSGYASNDRPGSGTR
jgi:hypothetical protein